MCVCVCVCVICYYLRVGPNMKDLCHSVVHILSLRDTILEPIVTVLIHVFDEQRVEGIDVSRQQLPLLLQLTLHLHEHNNTHSIRINS